jgi:hypothetical protein
MKPRKYTHLIFDKGAKKYIMENRQPLQQMFWEMWLSICKKLKLDPCLSLCTSINSKWIKDINIIPKTLKLGAGNTLEL